MAHHLSAPLASMYLADFGADVVKVETLEGEDWRQLNLNGAIMRVRHPKAGPMRTMGFPLTLAATPAHLRRGAPALGADTRAVLREFGYPSREIARLIQANTVHCV